MSVFRTFVVPGAVGAKAVAICEALGYPEKGMFTARIADGAEPATGPDTRPVISYIASGLVDDDCPLLGDADTLFAACQARSAAREQPLTVTKADCTAVLAVLDRGDIEPHNFIRTVIREHKKQVTPVPWEPDTTYGPHVAVSHGGVNYLNLGKANSTEPPGAGWRLLR